MVTTPFYLPVLGLIFLFTFSYLSIFPTMYKLLMVLLFYLFSVLLPTYLIHVYSKYEGWTTKQLINRERRMVPYVISILCYFLGFYLLTLMNTPDFISVIFVVAIIIQVLCAAVNRWWKISIHSAGIGGVTGMVVAFSFILSFDPTWWLCMLLLIAGLVGTARMVLRQHSLAQIVCGYLIGLASGFIIVMVI
ncbi:membrane protein [Prevotella lacticifex]|uniref:Membrane protein n=2 Tax=Prevotella lacticifex TaxID=2854755 RepID=A0A9R1CXQ4_9BACT|nr:membrane protein [Prevotella lacticifex]GJG38187.1 membrane protein [Prevotella lacticifex]GJG43130.1 membrane protein [Prevotella lacticifex]GJG44544.1 membrane protein [Prevotella lacticifex]GJG49481.1 membrane protein [Prevotella lacticifex]